MDAIDLFWSIFMCGIVGAVSSRNIVPILVQGLQRLEYRGYDSCGVAVHAASPPAAPRAWQS
jgi:glucosamine--fructose-6-phosphate aminotransferase (isomerizing)